MPLDMRRGLPNTVGVTSACTSVRSGRVPSIAHITTQPLASCARSDRSVSDAFVTSRMPSPVISNIPSSFTEPKRFFTARSSRYWLDRSPSKYSTASTMCSSTRGPAIAPSFVTCPTRNTAQSFIFARRMMCAAHSRTCDTLPGAEEISVRYIV